MTPAQDIVLNSIQPDAGVAPVVDFLNSATSSIDISTYRIDTSFTPVVDALKAAVARGVPVRISISRQLVGQDSPPAGNASQVQVADQFNAMGIQTQLSRPEFHYGHEKAIIIDAGQAGRQGHDLGLEPAGQLLRAQRLRTGRCPRLRRGGFKPG